MVCEPRVRRYNRSAGLVVLLAVLSSSIGAQVSTELSERAIAVGERVSYIITIDHEEPDDVEVGTPEFAGLRTVSGPTIRPVSLLIGSERERAVEVRFVLEATTAGRFVLPAVPVGVAGQPYRTEPKLIAIGEARDRTRVPFLARWAGFDGPLYAGEARVYALEIYNVPDYLYPSSVSLGTPENAILEEVQGLGTIERYTVDGVDLYTIPAALFMVTASEAGALTLPRTEIVADSLAATAPARSFEVVGLPEAVEPSGAVGSFSVSAAVNPQSMLRTETTELRLRVAGRGNLHFLGLPDAELTGFRIEHDRTERALSPTEYGYEGYVERVLTLRATSEGPYSVRVDEFVSLDPLSAQIRRQAVRLEPPAVLEANRPVGESGERVAIELLDRDTLAAMERRVWYDDPLAYGWFAPGALVLLASRVFRRKRVGAAIVLVVASFVLIDAASDRLPWEVIDRGYRRYAEGDLPAAVSAFERASRAVPDSAGLNHNLAVLYFQIGDTPRAVLGAREAVRFAPLSQVSRDLLTAIESHAGIERTIPPLHVVHPDHFFMLAAALVNLLFIVMAFTSGRKAASVITGTLLVLLIAGSAVGLGVAAVRHGRQLAVVRTDVTLRRIPGQDAAGWLPVQSGASVRVLSRNGNSLLIQTALGLEGWVELDSVFWHRIPAFALVRYRGFVL